MGTLDKSRFRTGEHGQVNLTRVQDHKVPRATFIQHFDNIHHALPHFHDGHTTSYTNAIRQQRVRTDVIRTYPDRIHSFIWQNGGGRNCPVLRGVYIGGELVLREWRKGTVSKVIGARCT